MRRYCCVIAVLFSILSSLYASAGTDIFSILKVNPSASSAGTGGMNSIVSSQMFQRNPATLPWLSSSEITFQYMSYLADLNYNSLAYTKSIGNESGIGVNLNYISAGGLVKTRYDSNPLNKDGYVQSGTFIYSDAIAGISFGTKIFPEISAGLSADVINESIDTYNKSGVYFAASMLYLPTDMPWRMGLGVINIGPDVAGYPLPASWYFSIGKKVSPNLLWMGEAEKGFDSDFELKTGFEYAMTDSLNLRLGYRNPLENPGLGGFIDYNFSAGLGLKFKTINLDYAWMPYGDLGLTHRISVVFKMGAPGAAERKSIMKYQLLDTYAVSGTKLAVANLAGKNVPESELVVISDFLRAELSNTGRFDILSREDMEKVFTDKGVPFPVCVDTKCAILLGKVLGVKRVVVGKISKTMGAYRLSISLVDVESGEMLKTIAQDESDLGHIREACWIIAQRLSSYSK